MDNKKNQIYYYEVIVPNALKKNLIYSFDQLLSIGTWVQVPLRSRQVRAVIFKKKNSFQSGAFSIRSISFVEDYPPLSIGRLHWLYWMAQYYHHPLEAVVHLSWPRSLKSKVFTSFAKKNKCLKKEIKEEKNLIEQKIVLTEEQTKCIQDIQHFGSQEFRVHLLHGVTGSGKTEIYFRLIESAVKKKRGVLILVPEISLTPQHIDRFSNRFPHCVVGLHSGLSIKEKCKKWTQVLRGEKTIVIGPRSALFCPIPKLSWIIVDEEHEAHFKQEEKLKYQARDSAVMLGKSLDIPVILASATPSLESWWNAQNGKYHYHQLKKRVFQTALPQFELVDMRKKTGSLNSSDQPSFSDLPWWMSNRLYQTIEEVLKKKEQVVLFINRRGEAGGLFCRACGFCFSCPDCDISLTLHSSKHLVCHYCGWRMEKPDACTQCREDQLFSVGLGTEAVQKKIQHLFPHAQILRADRDAIRNHREWTQSVHQIHNRQVDIVVGTQMIAKGLDFPFLTLVAVLLIDQGFNRPDFRSAEKNFQLITQIAGRAGRRKKLGKVILQTFHPDHPLLSVLMKGDYEQYANRELSQRKKYFYPPFSRLILIRTQSAVDTHALEAVLRIKDRISSVKQVSILGPAPARIFKLRKQYRYHLLLKGSHLTALHNVAQIISQSLSPHLPSGVQVHINCDPAELM